MQTFIDRYIEQGRQQGIKQGIEQGIEQGEANVLLRLITKKFGPPSESVRQRIAAADADTLLHWSERILTADSLEAVLH
jgi:flagellar biosynthesis/type III secretory pathway protein FliH